MVICLVRGADLHTALLMPLPLTVSCFNKIQSGFTFLVPAHLGSPGKWPLNGCVCVCVVTNKTTFDSYCCSHAAVSDTQDNVADYQMEPVHLTSKLLHEKVKSVYDYRCVISGAEIQSYVISLGVSKCGLPSFSLLYLCEIRSLPLTLALASNTAYCATAHMRDASSGP